MRRLAFVVLALMALYASGCTGRDVGHAQGDGAEGTPAGDAPATTLRRATCAVDFDRLVGGLRIDDRPIQVPAGQPVEVVLCGFPAGTEFEVSLDSRTPLGQIIADERGARISVTVPLGRAGVQSVLFNRLHDVMRVDSILLDIGGHPTRDTEGGYRTYLCCWEPVPEPTTGDRRQGIDIAVNGVGSFIDERPQSTDLHGGVLVTVYSFVMPSSGEIVITGKSRETGELITKTV